MRSRFKLRPRCHLKFGLCRTARGTQVSSHRFGRHHRGAPHPVGKVADPTSFRKWSSFSIFNVTNKPSEFHHQILGSACSGDQASTVHVPRGPLQPLTLVAVLRNNGLRPAGTRPYPAHIERKSCQRTLPAFLRSSLRQHPATIQRVDIDDSYDLGCDPTCDDLQGMATACQNCLQAAHFNPACPAPVRRTNQYDEQTSSKPAQNSGSRETAIPQPPNRTHRPA